MAKVATAFTPQIWSARFLGKLRQRLVWGSLVNRNYEGEIASAGDTVKIPTSSTTIMVNDYTPNTDIADAETVDGSTQDLLINKQKYFHFLVDDVDRAQTKPDVMDDAMDEASFQMSKQIDSDLRDVFNGAYAVARRTQVTQETSANDFGTNFLKAVAKVKRDMSSAYMPLDGRWMVIHPDTLEALETYFLTNNPSGVFLPRTAEATLMNGFAGMLMGFRLMVTTETPDGAAQASKATHRLFAGRGNEAVTHAMQIMNVETYRPEKRFGDAVKGLNVYGSKVVLPNRLWTIEHKKRA